MWIYFVEQVWGPDNSWKGETGDITSHYWNLWHSGEIHCVTYEDVEHLVEGDDYIEC